MANTVAARFDESKLPVISGTGAHVASFFVAWLALIFVLGARGAFVGAGGGPAARITDRPRSAAHAFPGRVQRHPASSRVYFVG